MNVLHLPWVEAAIALAWVGALCISQVRHPSLAYRWGLLFTGSVFLCTFLAWLSFFDSTAAPAGAVWSVQPYLFGQTIFRLDELNAPLVPVVALLHFLTALATARTKMRRFSFSWSLAAESIRLATFSCTHPGVLVGLLIADTVPPYIELLNRRKPTRVYLLHLALFVGLLLAGWAAVSSSALTLQQNWTSVPLLAAILVRCGAIPAHCWVTDWFEHASFGNALLFVTPLAGVYAAVRLVLPQATDWMLQSISLLSLVTALYTAGMAVVQRDVRRFFAYLFLSHASLVLVGLELHTAISLTGALCLWFSVILSLGGFGLTLRALEARFGRLSLVEYYGLYEHTPTLAVCFLLTGLASVGFPGTLGFISTELLVDGAIAANSYMGVGVIAAGTLNGIAVLRAYFLLFTGRRHTATVSLRTGLRERIAVLTLAALILGGGLFPQPGVESRHLAAEQILQERQTRSELTRQRRPAAAADLPNRSPG